MKKINSTRHSMLHGMTYTLLLTAAITMASCDLSDDDALEPIIVIEPPTREFVFDKESIPRPANQSPQLSEEMQQAIQQEVIGHGWRCLQTLEIGGTGWIIYRDYYATHPQARCCNYHFRSDEELTTYSLLNGHTSGGGYYNWDISMDYTNGDVRMDMPGDKYFLLNILKVFELDGHWYMATIERLGMNGGGLGMLDGGFAYSEYVQMTDDELARYQTDYQQDWRMINLYTE